MADYDYLPASNGSGDAALMHITTNRSIGATTIVVDSVTNVPAKFIATAGTLGSNGLITPATAVNFKGHVSAGTLVIDAFEPGSTDAGNTSGQVVIIKPTTGWSNRIASFIKNATGFGTPEAVTFSSVSVDTVTELTSGHGVSVAGVNHKGSAIADSGGLAVIEVGGVASAVNHVKATNAVTGGAPTVAPEGSDTNSSLVIKGKGTGAALVQELLITPSSTNYAASWGTGGLQAQLAQVVVPAQPVNVRVWLHGALQGVSLGSGGPTQNSDFRIIHSGSGTIVASTRQTKVAASGITEVRPFYAVGYYDLAAGTSATFNLTGGTDGFAALGAGEQTMFVARVVAR